jgi:hypothetical protein
LIRVRTENFGKTEAPNRGNSKHLEEQALLDVKHAINGDERQLDGDLLRHALQKIHPRCMQQNGRKFEHKFRPNRWKQRLPSFVSPMKRRLSFGEVRFFIAIAEKLQR